MIYVTGGGSYLLSDVLTQPGASESVLEARIPYAQESISQLIGQTEFLCSKKASCALAMHAYKRSLELSPKGQEFGFACTASLRTTQPKRGDHRAHIALQTASSTKYWRLDLNKGALSRMEEERVLADYLSSALFSGLELMATKKVDPIDSVVVNSEVSGLVVGSCNHLYKRSNAFLPGSFNPLHSGHEHMKQVAEKILDEVVQYELCLENVDKPALDFFSLNERMKQFNEGSFVLTSSPSFLEKTRVLGGNEGCTFVLGFDTFDRLLSPKYYGGSEWLRDQAIDEIVRLDTKFVVFGREKNGVFRTLSDLNVPSPLRRNCYGVTEAEFRMDVSSTQLREDKRH